MASNLAQRRSGVKSVALPMREDVSLADALIDRLMDGVRSVYLEGSWPWAVSIASALVPPRSNHAVATASAAPATGPTR
jgi:hypothetical protein